MGGADQVAKAPARDGIRFGKGAAGDRALPHARQRAEIGVHIGLEDDVLIHLIRDDECVVLFRKRGDGGKLLPREHLAGGVGRVAEDERLRVLLEGGFKLCRVKMEIRRQQGDVDRLRAGKDRVRAVVFIERREYDDLVPGVADGHHCGHHGFCAAAGHDDLRIRVDVVPKGAGLLVRKRPAEVGRAEGDGILVRAGITGLCERIEDLARRVKIREALREVDRAMRVADARHAADDGVGELGNSFAQFGHKYTPLYKK